MSYEERESLPPENLVCLMTDLEIELNKITTDLHEVIFKVYNLRQQTTRTRCQNEEIFYSDSEDEEPLYFNVNIIDTQTRSKSLLSKFKKIYGNFTRRVKIGFEKVL